MLLSDVKFLIHLFFNVGWAGFWGSHVRPHKFVCNLHLGGSKFYPSVHMHESYIVYVHTYLSV